MQSLPDALAFVRKGWNPAAEIRDRASLMRGHAEAGNYERAEEYALEIEQLQSAAGVKPLVQPEWGTHQFKIGYVRWSENLRRGYLSGRAFWTDGPNLQDAAGHARFLLSNPRITASDLL
jgi:hypothetical protein